MWKTHCNHRWLFPNRAGTRPVTYEVLARTLAHAARAAASAPGSRRTCCATALMVSLSNHATRLLEHSVDLRPIQILLGHLSITSALIDTHLTEPIRAKLRTLLDKLMSGL